MYITIEELLKHVELSDGLRNDLRSCVEWLRTRDGVLKTPEQDSIQLAENYVKEYLLRLNSKLINTNLPLKKVLPRFVKALETDGPVLRSYGCNNFGVGGQLRCCTMVTHPLDLQYVEEVTGFTIRLPEGKFVQYNWVRSNSATYSKPDKKAMLKIVVEAIKSYKRYRKLLDRTYTYLDTKAKLFKADYEAGHINAASYVECLNIILSKAKRDIEDFQV